MFYTNIFLHFEFFFIFFFSSAWDLRLYLAKCNCWNRYCVTYRWIELCWERDGCAALAGSHCEWLCGRLNPNAPFLMRIGNSNLFTQKCYINVPFVVHLDPLRCSVSCLAPNALRHPLAAVASSIRGTIQCSHQSTVALFVFIANFRFYFLN